MTARSQNGYPANDRDLIRSFTIPGTHERVALRRGAVAVVLLDVTGFINAEVTDIEQRTLDEWGYAERTIRGSSTTLSNHASGTAIDVDARRHPLGQGDTWTDRQKRKIHRRLAAYDGVVRWGQDYHGRKDGMHFEINAALDRVKRLAGQIRDGRLPDGMLSYLVGRRPFHADHPATPVLREGDHGYAVERLQHRLNAYMGRHHPKRDPLEEDGRYGPATSAAVRVVEKDEGLVVNGVANDPVWAALGVG